MTMSDEEKVERKQKAEPPFIKAARLSTMTRGFPYLLSGKFGFISNQHEVNKELVLFYTKT